MLSRDPVLQALTLAAKRADHAVIGKSLLKHGTRVPAATPDAITARLNGDLARIAALPAVKEHFAGQGLEPVHTSTAEARPHPAPETAKWGKMVKVSGARPD